MRGANYAASSLFGPRGDRIRLEGSSRQTLFARCLLWRYSVGTSIQYSLLEIPLSYLIPRLRSVPLTGHSQATHCQPSQAEPSRAKPVHFLRTILAYPSLTPPLSLSQPTPSLPQSPQAPASRLQQILLITHAVPSGCSFLFSFSPLLSQPPYLHTHHNTTASLTTSPK